ncbi:SDR family NAD(P)-dependent oxidoreductase [bacterium]|nr:SDR family NAD(P)-dependent oxidoreductase [bacterium]
MGSELKGRVAIVSGGSKGIGKAIAKSLANEGVNVVICARGVEALETVQKEIQQSGGNAVIASADATDPDAVRDVIATAIERFGGLDILVNNVGGVNRFAGFLELTDDEGLEAF